MTGVRWRPDTGFEGKCDRCLEWWPITDTACWSPKSGLKRCKACLAEISAERNRIRRQDPAERAADREAVRLARLAMATDRRLYYRELYRKNRDRINALARARYVRRKQDEATKIRKRDWMRQYRERMTEHQEAA